MHPASGEFEETLSRFRDRLPTSSDQPINRGQQGADKVFRPELRERLCTISLLIHAGARFLIL